MKRRALPFLLSMVLLAAAGGPVAGEELGDGSALTEELSAGTLPEEAKIPEEGELILPEEAIPEEVMPEAVGASLNGGELSGVLAELMNVTASLVNRRGTAAASATSATRAARACAAATRTSGA